MHPIEKIATKIRYSSYLKNTNRLWKVVRPWYSHLLATVGKTGLERTINNTDRILILPELHQLSESYEPDVWCAVMKEIKQGDTLVDVGASLGLYTIACGLRIGPSGAVHAFEPDPASFQYLTGNVKLNQLAQIVHMYPYAVGEHSATIYFNSGRGVESAVATTDQAHNDPIRCVTLSEMFPQTRIDILKIDVEGFEEPVLRGASSLLQDKSRAPRTIFIEMHPFAWEKFGTSDTSLLGYLHRHGYQTYNLTGHPINQVPHYCEIVARLCQ